MSTVDDILNYQIETTSLAQDREYFQKLGDRLRKAMKDDITDTLISTVSQNLHFYFNKLDEHQKLTQPLETSLQELKGKAYGLEQSFDSKNFDDAFYIRALNLGSLIFDISKNFPSPVLLPLVVYTLKFPFPV